MFNLSLAEKTIFITGVAGFIGSNLAKRLCNTIKDIQVIGIDNMNDYYDVSLKEARLAQLKDNTSFTFIRGNISNKDRLEVMIFMKELELYKNGFT